MRKSGWAAATGLGSLVLLLAACGGSSGGSTSAAGGGASSLPSSSSGSAPAPAASSATGMSTSSPGGGATSTAKAKAKPHKSVGPQPSGPADERSIPPVGTTVIIVQKSAIGYVMAEANHDVLYTYDKDKKGGKPTCVGECAATWLPATGTPQAGPADHFPGQFALVKRSDGTEQITYDGMPLYTLKGAKPLLTTGNGRGGVWHVVKLSASNIG
jgi:predicted lipoprotein with Yx(FWY)xxD motif